MLQRWQADLDGGEGGLSEEAVGLAQVGGELCQEAVQHWGHVQGQRGLCNAPKGLHRCQPCRVALQLVQQPLSAHSLAIVPGTHLLS